MATILVTGVSGEIGSEFLLERLTLNNPVRALSRRPPPERRPNLSWVQGDLRDEQTLIRVCEGAEAVLHMAAVTHARRPSDYLEVNVQGTLNLIRAARAARVRRFVYMSSAAVGLHAGAYAHSKYFAEDGVRRSELPFVILRPSEIYGGSRGDDAISRLATWLATKSFVPIPGDGSARLCPVHVRDIENAIVSVLGNPGIEDQTYVLAGPEEMTYMSLVERLESLLELPVRRRVRIPFGLAQFAIGLTSRLGVGSAVPDQIPRLRLQKCYDISAAQRDLGFRPGRIEDCFRPG